MQHLKLSEVLVHIQIIVRNKSEPLDTFSSFCKSLDERCRRQKNINPQKSALFTSKQNIAFRRAQATLIGGSQEKGIY